jgi:hypothetical protein
MALAACSAENNQMGLLLGPDNDVQVLYVRCAGETVSSVRLWNGDTDEVIWRITADDPSTSGTVTGPQVLRFDIGEAPPGFRTNVSLAAPLTNQNSYSLSVEGRHQEGFPLIDFSLDKLDGDEVFGPIEGPTEEFIRRASAECIPLPRFSVLELALRFAFFGLALIGLATIGRWLSPNGR